METILQAQPEIDAVYTHDDDMAEGVVSAIENAGREDEMFLTGAGGSTAAMERIQEGGLYAGDLHVQPVDVGLGRPGGPADRPRRGLRGAGRARGAELHRAAGLDGDRRTTSSEFIDLGF